MSKSKEEALIQCAIAAHLGEKNIMIPNVSFARTSCRVPKYGNNGQLVGHEYPFKGVRHEADLIWINDNDYLTEVEIKTSYSDFLADTREQFIMRFRWICTKKMRRKSKRCWSKNSKKQE